MIKYACLFILKNSFVQHRISGVKIKLIIYHTKSLATISTENIDYYREKSQTSKKPLGTNE